MSLRGPAPPGDARPFPRLAIGTFDLHSLKVVLVSKFFSQTPSYILRSFVFCTSYFAHIKNFFCGKTKQNMY